MADKGYSFQTLNDEIERSLLEKRRIYFSGTVDSRSVDDAIRKVWYLEGQAPGKPITLIINSPGGSVDAGFALWDQLKLAEAPITTVVTGLAASMGSVLSLAADKGKRYATPNARIMIHQPSIGGVTGSAADLEITAKEILKTRERLIELYCESTGQDKEAITKALDRDYWMSPPEAKEFGLIDKIVDSYEGL